MARVQNTLIGRASGSVGGATFSTWKGINVLKEKPITVANPRTEGQTAQRSRLSVMVAFYRTIAQIIQVGFSSLAIGKSQYNAFLGVNIVPATTIDGSNSAVLAPILLKISKGSMGVTPLDDADFENGVNTITAYWNDGLIPIGGASDDIPYVLVFNQTQNLISSGNNGVRSDGAIDVPAGYTVASGDVLFVYLFFKDNATNLVSDSQVLSITKA